MADHSKPTTTSLYTDVLSDLDGRLDDIALGLDPANTSPTNVPTNAIRWTSASNKWQKWNGTAWSDLSSGYSININGTVGATTPAAGTFTTLASTGNTTLGDASGDAVTINAATISTPNGLNFDSNTFVIDAANNRVGIGAASPSAALDVQYTDATVYSSTTAPTYNIQALNLSATTGAMGGIRTGARNVNSQTASHFIGTISTATNYLGDFVVQQRTDSATYAERMRIDSSGNVGIGTSSPGARLNIVDATSNDALRITQTGTGNALVVEDAANPDSTPVVIDASGRVLSGFTAPFAGLPSVSAEYQQLGAIGWSILGRYGANSTSPIQNFVKSRSTTIGSWSIVSSGDGLGGLRMYGDDGSTFVEGARIEAAVDGTPGTNDMPGRLVFSTTADGASSPTERMRITSAGNVGIGASAPAAKLEISSTNGGVTDPLLANTRLRFTDSDTTKANNQVTGGIEWYTADTDAAGVYAYISSATNSSGDGYVTFATGSSSTIAERMRIDSSGNVLVGKTTGSYKVDVSGDVNVTGSFLINGVATTGLTGGQTGSAPLYGARAWVNFNGTGTVAIRASGNVSSITDTAAGRFTINFATALPDADYSIAGSAGNDGTTTTLRGIVRDGTWTTTACQIRNITSGGSNTDDQYIGVVVFR